jgi:hypothetical protein
MPSPPDSAALASLVRGLASPLAVDRSRAATELFAMGSALGLAAARGWLNDAELARCFARDASGELEITVGVAVEPGEFEAIREACGRPALAEVPADQDAREFELDFPASGASDSGAAVRLDILTTRDAQGGGAIARYLAKFSAGIQQIEFRVHSVEAATELLGARFGVQPIYATARGGANGTRVNFFLVAAGAQKVLIELFELPPRH